ncbi:hypothetical protein [Herbaspirillum sp. VT-16-41]|uniref:hypothetical protein n=1 Tax=Herbaspirillum sp. VT-16-41 TaxID=1953765 RepID=UPI000982391A|nr:hypothetical protein [Herbaspirillum sp. VT-16-41]ONN68136.1 hypothetical protein BTM36_01910 [Herbaspirillum sp. VT-16-41]
MTTTFPDYAKIQVDTFQESPGSVMKRTAMDRGVPKQRRVQSDVLVTVSFSVFLTSLEDQQGFEDWYYGDAGMGTVWFDWLDPRTNIIRSVRVVADSLGPLKQLQPLAIGLGSRSIQLEYVKNL